MSFEEKITQNQKKMNLGENLVYKQKIDEKIYQSKYETSKKNLVNFKQTKKKR